MWHHGMNDPKIADTWIGHGKFEARHENQIDRYDAELFAMVDGLPCGWRQDVYAEMSRRTAEKARAKRQAATEALDTTPAIRAYLLSQMDTRGYTEPRKEAFRGTTGTRVSYTPKAGCAARLKLKDAVWFRYTQESYADHSQCAIPVEGNPDSPECRSNLNHWADALRTHTGFAGSGCTYSASLMGSAEGGWWVLLDQRASIAD